MKRTAEEHAARFDEKADSYDDDKSEEYKAAVELVVRHADPGPEDTVLDLGTGTGAIALRLAPDAGRVVGRDVSEGMMERAREKAAEQGVENVEFGEGTFREPNVAEQSSAGSGTQSQNVDEADIVVSNFAMHHLSDDEKRDAIQVIADIGARRFVLGDVMLFAEADPSEPFYSPEVDDPATVGVLADAFTDAGFALTAVERIHDQVGVLVAERA